MSKKFDEKEFYKNILTTYVNVIREGNLLIVKDIKANYGCVGKPELAPPHITIIIRESGQEISKIRFNYDEALNFRDVILDKIAFVMCEGEHCRKEMLNDIKRANIKGANINE